MPICWHRWKRWRDASDPREYERALEDGLEAIRAAASHRVPTSAEGLLFLHDCIETELQFLRDIPSDPQTHVDARRALRRMFATLEEIEKPVAA
jgi:hypothetical protein